MFRTRDFVLLFTIIVFLVAGIGVTVLDQWFSTAGSQSAEVGLAGVAPSAAVLTATLPEDTTESDRIRRLNSMREKVATVPFEDAEAVVEEEPVETLATSSDTASVAGSETIFCANYTEYAGFWDSRNLEITPREGAIVIERVVGSTSVPVLQLRAATTPVATPTCIGSDVIGIANDGSLIRNDELALYGIFSNTTMIGYALDGFPIYGTGADRTDVCGGRMVAAQYRYELSTDRETLLGCFSGVVSTLP